MNEAQMQTDYAAVGETYWQDGGLFKWKVDLANGSVLNGEIPFDPSKGEEALKALCRMDAQVMLFKFLGLDSTTLVQELDPSRVKQIAQFEADLAIADIRLHNLRNGITTGVYLDVEQLSIAEQIQQLESYKSVIVRKLNRMKL